MSSEVSSARAAVDADRQTIKYFENGGVNPPTQKVELVNSNSANATDDNPASEQGCSTFAIWHEDHTLANSLRHLIIKDEEVEFCGYSIPHPSEAKVHVRIQTRDESTTAVNALNRGLDNLIDITDHVMRCFEEELLKGDYIKDSDAEF